MKKQTAILLLALLMTVAFSLSAYSMGTYSLNETRTTMNMSFNGDEVTCSVQVTGISATTKIVCDYTLYRVESDESLTVVKEFPQNTSTIRVCRFEDTAPCEVGETYLLEVVAQITANGVTETVLRQFTKTNG